MERERKKKLAFAGLMLCLCVLTAGFVLNFPKIWNAERIAAEKAERESLGRPIYFKDLPLGKYITIAVIDANSRTAVVVRFPDEDSPRDSQQPFFVKDMQMGLLLEMTTFEVKKETGKEVK